MNQVAETTKVGTEGQSMENSPGQRFRKGDHVTLTPSAKRQVRILARWLMHKKLLEMDLDAVYTVQSSTEVVADGVLLGYHILLSGHNNPTLPERMFVLMRRATSLEKPRFKHGDAVYVNQGMWGRLKQMAEYSGNQNLLKLYRTTSSQHIIASCRYHNGAYEVTLMGHEEKDGDANFGWLREEVFEPSE